MDNYKISHTEESIRISARVDPLLKKLITMIANKEAAGNASKVIEKALWEAVKKRGFDTSSITTTTKRNKSSNNKIQEIASFIKGPSGYEVPVED
ncbi:hypothetical protein SAMN05443144_13312 [Fodinibius roseus]|uniref:Uncharacterized protein n=1 Tax=Fodinibius roseus TaxID=1194090 RepID=A0A1M5KPR0_9BACT|nr:hypothetical protein [Fodinibius roseus]SHG54173.1 hypothetical protein SAMN05443144_13312 [Fodinibius roseus]